MTTIYAKMTGLDRIDKLHSEMPWLWGVKQSWTPQDHVYVQRVTDVGFVDEPMWQTGNEAIVFVHTARFSTVQNLNAYKLKKVVLPGRDVTWRELFERLDAKGVFIQHKVLRFIVGGEGLLRTTVYVPPDNVGFLGLWQSAN